jgi:hypothetical protein
MSLSGSQRTVGVEIATAAIKAQEAFDAAQRAHLDTTAQLARMTADRDKAIRDLKAWRAETGILPVVNGKALIVDGQNIVLLPLETLVAPEVNAPPPAPAPVTRKGGRTRE